MSALSRSMGKLVKQPPTADRRSDMICALSTDPSRESCDPNAYYSLASSLKTINTGDAPHMDVLHSESQVFSWSQSGSRRPSGIVTFAPTPPPSPPLTPVAPSQPPTKRDSKALTAIASLFQGESAPIALGVVPSPTKELDDPHDAMDWPPLVARRGPNLTTRPASPTKSARESPIAALFGGLMSPAKSEVSFGTEKGSMEADDIWLGLDLRNALLPSTGDLSSPGSFDGLLTRAEDLFSRMQSAYRNRVIAVADAEAEVAAQQEETEEAQTRAKHLKHQLDELSSKSEEQDNVIMGLVQDLAEEKEARRADARARTIRVIDTIATKHDKKQSRNSIQSVDSDSGFESNTDSIAVDDEETIDGYCSSPEIEFARSASFNRGAASLVYTSSKRLPKAHTQECQQLNSSTQDSNKRKVSGWNGERKPLPIAALAVELFHGGDGHEPDSTSDRERSLHDENAQLKERNKFLEAELEAVKRMIEDVMLLAPSGTSSRKNSHEQCV